MKKPTTLTALQRLYAQLEQANIDVEPLLQAQRDADNTLREQQLEKAIMAQLEQMKKERADYSGLIGMAITVITCIVVVAMFAQSARSDIDVVTKELAATKEEQKIVLHTVHENEKTVIRVEGRLESVQNQMTLLIKQNEEILKALENSGKRR